MDHSPRMLLLPFRGQVRTTSSFKYTKRIKGPDADNLDSKFMDSDRLSRNVDLSHKIQLS